MFPLIRDGDFILFRAVTVFDSLKVGDVVQFEHKDYGDIVKLIDHADAECVRVRGLAKISVDTNILGSIPKGHIRYFAVLIFSKPQNHFFGFSESRILTRNDIQAFIDGIR